MTQNSINSNQENLLILKQESSIQLKKSALERLETSNKKSEIIETGSKKRPKSESRHEQSKKLREDLVEVEPEYQLMGGLRKVVPYDYTYTAFAKGRWLGKELLQVFQSEFNVFRDPIYYQWAIENGQIRINGEMVPCDYIVKNSDLIQTKSHRHEPPISSQSIEIVHDSEDLLVVSKPCSYPVHPTGKYRFNTLIQVLKHDKQYAYAQQLYLVNRIDRLTSGLVLIAKTKERASKMSEQLRDRNIKKTYLARVRGDFPDGIIECNEPIMNISAKVGLNAVHPDGKPCHTIFTKLGFNGTTSLVKCEPKTGRTHQIRVHLQYLGYPIANDPHYGSSAFGEDRGKGGIQDFDKIITEFNQRVFPAINGIKAEKDYVGCVECKDENLRHDPLPEQITLWLHSLKYEGDGWVYETSYPEWAKDDWNGDQDIEERFWKKGGCWDGAVPGAYIMDQ